MSPTARPQINGNLPTGGAPAAPSQRYSTSVRVGGRHYALVWLEGLEADTVYQYTVALAPQPPTGPLPNTQSDFTEPVFPKAPRYGAGPSVDLREIAFTNAQWLFFRTLPARFETFTFAHGSCRKWPGDKGVPPPAPVGKACARWVDPKEEILEPSPDMLDALGDWLAGRSWRDWPRFFLHTGDQIYADDIGIAMGGSIVRHRFAAVIPGPPSTLPADVAFGAWSGRFAARYAALSGAPPAAPAADLDSLCELRPRVTHHNVHDIDYSIKLALRARRQSAFARSQRPLPLPFNCGFATTCCGTCPTSSIRCRASTNGLA